MLLTAEEELEKYFKIHLEPKDRVNILKAIKLDLENELSRVTNRKQRIPLLAKLSMIDRCIEIINTYYVLDIVERLEK